MLVFTVECNACMVATFNLKFKLVAPFAVNYWDYAITVSDLGDSKCKLCNTIIIHMQDMSFVDTSYVHVLCTCMLPLASTCTASEIQHNCQVFLMHNQAMSFYRFCLKLCST